MLNERLEVSCVLKLLCEGKQACKNRRSCELDTAAESGKMESDVEERTDGLDVIKR